MGQVFNMGWRSRFILFLASLGAGFAFWTIQSRLPDPVVDDRRMSRWAATLLDHRTNCYAPYGYSRTHRQVFAANRELAIPHLMAATRYPTELDRSRIQLSRKLPKPLARWVKPEDRRPYARWLGILALSDLARIEPDARIPAFFLHCMDEQLDATLRKIAAYEAGPWLEPGHHTTSVQILRRALEDDAPLVRRDACRRIAESAGRKDPTFTAAVQVLHPVLEKLRLEDPVHELREHARRAQKQLAL